MPIPNFIVTRKASVQSLYKRYDELPPNERHIVNAAFFAVGVFLLLLVIVIVVLAVQRH